MYTSISCLRISAKQELRQRLGMEDMTELRFSQLDKFCYQSDCNVKTQY